MGTTAEYVALIASVVPMSWDEACSLPLAVGLQLRNLALHEGGVTILPPGRNAEKLAGDVLGDHAEEFFGGDD